MDSVEYCHVRLFFDAKRHDCVIAARKILHLLVPDRMGLYHDNIFGKSLFPCLQCRLKMKAMTAVIRKYFSHFDFAGVAGSHRLVEHNVMLSGSELPG